VDSRRAIVIGSDRLGLRIGEQLEQDGCAVAVVALPGSWLAEAVLPPNWKVVRARPDTPGVLAQAGLADADALLAVSDEDEVNLGAALAARETRPDVRLVLRQFNLRLARLLEAYLPDAQILSLSAATAPTFALAALGPDVLFAHDTGEEVLVLRDVPVGNARHADGEAILAVATESGVSFFPGSGARASATRVLIAERASDLPRHPSSERAEPAAAARVAVRSAAERDPLLGLTLGALLLVLVGVAIAFVWRLGLSPLDAVYFVSTILTTVGFGDFNLRDADATSKVIGIGAMFSGLFLSALLVGLVTNKLLARQELRRQGRYRLGLRDHVVVCGLGTMGVRIAEALTRLGQSVVAVDPEPTEGRAGLVRAAGIPLVLGDATQERTLGYANLTHARALVVATSRDHLNLEIGLVARSLVPGLPVVLRLFDQDLCRRVTRTFGIEATFSGATLGAGLFAAFAAGATRLASLHFAGAACELHRVIGPDGATLEDAAGAVGGRPVALVDIRGRVRVGPSSSERLEPGASLLVLVPQPGPRPTPSSGEL
jgi:Trk K+ transport system NAD-binding subunit